MKFLRGSVLFVAMCVLLSANVFASVVVALGDSSEILETNDSCYAATASDYTGDVYTDFGIVNLCDQANTIAFQEDINLSVLGGIREDEVIVTETWVYVDSAARPDLDVPAIIYFNNPPFAVEPKVLRDGSLCEVPECNSTYLPEVDRLSVEVGGFSNYSLTAKQDFIVYSDVAPELDNKVYQTIDLGDGSRNQTFSCIVQIFGQSAETPGQWVLVQTNPEREVQGRLLGNPDSNQPESLGYFPTVNGVANVYFRDQNIPGYNDFEYVAQCSNSTDKLVYEEPISTRYHPFGREMVGRGVWLTSGTNMLFLILAIVMVVMGVFLFIRMGKTWFG